MFETQEKLLQAIINCLPYSNQIKDLDLSGEKDYVRFTWRSCRYRIGLDGDVEQVGEGVLMGTDICIIFRALIKMEWSSKLTYSPNS